MVFESFIALALPRSCPLCGRPLLPAGGKGAAPTLCRDCARDLVPIEGELCMRCGKPLVSELGLCMRCRERDWPFDSAISLYSYRDKAEALIGAYKFRNRFSLAPFLAEACASRLLSLWPGLPLVPVPFRRKKIVEKGWDQVEILARALEARGFQVKRLLERLPSGEQKRLGLEARLVNARRAYRLKKGALVPPALVLLDDVFTTGATAAACAEALKEGGAATVHFLALASD